MSFLRIIFALFYSGYKNVQIYCGRYLRTSNANLHRQLFKYNTAIYILMQDKNISIWV